MTIIKGKMDVRFPANVRVQVPLLLDRSGGTFTFSVDINGLAQMIEGNTGAFQSVTTANDTILPTTTLLVVQRTAPALTQLEMPPLDGAARLRILDWSTSVTDHEIRLTPQAGSTIMRAATWSAFSNAAQLTSLALSPSIPLNAWYLSS